MVRPTAEGPGIALPEGSSSAGIASGDDVDWDTSDISPPVLALDQLSDVEVPTPADGDALVWDDYLQLWVPGSAGSPDAELNIEGGQSVISAHGSTGATETIDPTAGNVHTLTLDADCTITLGAPVGSGACLLELWVTQDGTGGWDITWPGSVTWPGGSAPTVDTTAGVLVRYTLETLDGGTNWYGAVVGSEGSATLALDDLTDVTITTPGDGEVLTYDSGTSEWVNAAATATVASLDDIGDVDVPTPTDGYLLAWDDYLQAWVAVAPPSGSVPDGTNAGDILAWDGAAWDVLPVGTDGQMLYADSGEALGLLWDAAPAGGGELAFGSAAYTGANKTTTSGAFADVDATNCSITMTTGARRVKLTATFIAYMSTTNSLCFDYTIDTTRQGDTLGLLFTNNTQPTPFTLVFITGVLSAASHTFRLQFMRTTSGTGTIYTNSGGAQIRMWAEELNLTS